MEILDIPEMLVNYNQPFFIVENTFKSNDINRYWLLKTEPTGTSYMGRLQLVVVSTHWYYFKVGIPCQHVHTDRLCRIPITECQLKVNKFLFKVSQLQDNKFELTIIKFTPKNNKLNYFTFLHPAPLPPNNANFKHERCTHSLPRFYMEPIGNP